MSTRSIWFVLCAPLLFFPRVATPDDLKTVKTTKGPLEVVPLEHATFVLKWNDKVIYNDPVGGEARFKGQTAPDVKIITDIHGAH